MNKKSLIIIGAIAGVLVIGTLLFTLFRYSSLREEVKIQNDSIQQLKLSNEQLQLSNEYAAIDAEFQSRENAAIRLENDTILAKYTASKAKIEELIKELNNEKKKSKDQIAKLEAEIKTLRGLLKHYIAQIDTLSKENAELRSQNEDLSTRNESLQSKVSEVSEQNRNLNEIKTRAEKLNVTGVQLTALNKKGKNEKNITKARQLMVTFTISPNVTAPAGNKTIFLRLLGPEGQLLGQGGHFSFEGASVAFTEKKTVEYNGNELAGVRIYWDVNATLNPGDYTVELFCDNFRLAQRHFTMKK